MKNKEILISLLLRFLTAIASLLISVIISRSFGPEGRGHYIFIVAIAGSFSLFYFSIHQSVLVLAKRHGIKNTHTIYSWIFFSISFVLVPIYYFFIVRNLKIDTGFFGYISILLFLPSTYLLSLLASFYQAIDKVLLLNKILFYSKLFSVILILFGVFIGVGVEYFFIPNIISAILIYILYVKELSFGKAISMNFNRTRLFEIGKESIKIHASTVATFYLFEYNSIYIGINFSKYQLGLYDVWVQISGIIFLSLSGFVPLIYSKGINLDKKMFRLYFNKIFFFSLVCLLTASIFILLFCDRIILYVYGINFIEALKFRFLFIAYAVIQGITTILGPLFVINDRTIDATILTLSAGFIQYTCYYFFNPGSINELLYISITISFSVLLICLLYAHFIFKAFKFRFSL